MKKYTLFSAIALFSCFFLKAQDKVGINIAVPEFNFDIRSTAIGNGVEFNLANADNSRFLRFFTGSTFFPNPVAIWSEGSHFRFATDEGVFSEKMRIQSDGNVGIGTTNALALLDVNGRLRVSDDASTPQIGQIRWNNTDDDFEGYDGTIWRSLTGIPPQGSIAPNQLRDVDGNVYKTVIIGTQEWMAENLRTTKFHDGSSISYAPQIEVWRQLDQSMTPAYSWPNNDQDNSFPYGALYNGYVVDNNMVCPTGWHIPDDTEWDVLFNLLSTNVGLKMKAKGDLTTEDGLWTFSAGNLGTNESGFTAIPAGYRGTDGGFFNISLGNFFWSTTPSISNLTTHWVSHASANKFSNGYSKRRGHSIRCLKN